MSVYTTQLSNILATGDPIFDFDYPIFDENYRPVLENNIINHYYFREIGLETVGQFKHFLKAKLNVIMPYYNQLYETIGLVTNENYNTNLNTTEEHNRTIESQSQENNTAESNGKSVFSDTPQAPLQNLDYATNLTEDNGSSTGTSEGNTNTIENYIIKTTGSGGMRYNSDILMEYRKTFINVDKMIIDELNDLFMNVY